jgi:hypothetical protein
VFLTACAGRNIPAPSSVPSSVPTPTLEQPTVTPTTFLPPERTPTPICSDNLIFIIDVTIPDRTVVAPGSLLDKQWQVKNSGDCNWDTRYRLRFISGDALGAATEQALLPARAGTEATLRILFTAPQEAGEYVSEWQAFDANGIPFGESFYIKIEVQQ